MFARFRPIFRHYSALSSKRLTVDPKEIETFQQMAIDNWWDEQGIVKPLHAFNNTRIPWIKERLSIVGSIGPKIDETAPLRGLSVLDVGCGGGILTEPLSRLGCNATGLDATEELINVAKLHAKTQNLPNLNYVCATIQEYAVQNKEKFDVVVSSETIEHVTEKDEFLKYCVQCLKPGGSIFMTTPNKTYLSWFYTIIVFENVLKVIPKGVHRYEMFIHSRDLIEMLSDENCTTVFTSGVIYNPFKNKWELIKNQNVMAYALHAIKNYS